LAIVRTRVSVVDLAAARRALHGPSPVRDEPQSPARPSAQSPAHALRVAATAALAVTGLWFWLSWRYGFDLADEGYYWYGAQRVVLGEVPMRDFNAYDIGRYYWTAAFMAIAGDPGLFTARVGAVVFQGLATWLGVWLCISRHAGSEPVRWALALAAAALLAIWFWPYYKAFDHGTSVAVVGAIALLLKRQDRMSWLLSGVCIGLAATIGRNHGVYGAVAACLAAGLLLRQGAALSSLARLGLLFVLGCLLGMLPNIGMAVTVDGFATAFADSVLWLFEFGATNIPRPVPWPWRFEADGSGFLLSAARLAPGFGFMLLITVPALALAVLLRAPPAPGQPCRAIPAAAALAAVPYAHYAFSRADTTHLALAIFPALIAIISFASAARGARPLWVLGALLLGSVFCLGGSHPYLSTQLFGARLLAVDIDGERILSRSRTIRRLDLARALEKRFPSEFQRLLAVPDMTGLYAVHRMRMPVWEIYATFPRNEAAERSEIRRLELSRPQLLIVSDHALDGREALRYSRSHPLIHGWIVQHHVRIEIDGLADPELAVYRPR
jgi:hypothetical protein